MELMIATLPAKFVLLERAHLVYDGTLFIQIRFKMYYDHEKYIFKLSNLIEPDMSENFSIQCEYHSEFYKYEQPENFMRVIGMKKVFSFFKNEVFSMIEKDLETEVEMAPFRLMLLPL